MLSVYDFNTNDDGINSVERLLYKEYSLTNASLKFGVSNQTLAIGDPRTILTTPITKSLFRMPDPLDPIPYGIYGAFNTVVFPDQTPPRVGCGVRSVTIWTGPGPA